MPLRKGSNTPMNIKKGVTQIEKVKQGSNLIWKYRTDTPSISFVSKDESSITFDVTNNDERSVTVYYGTSSNTTANPTPFNEGETKRLTLSGLDGGTSYTVRTRAQGFQSLFSGEVSFTQTTEQSFVTNGLLAHFDASDSNSYPGSGSTWFDLSGNGYNASLSNTSYSSTNGGVLNFNGSNSRGTIPYNSAFKFSSFTLEGWAKITGGSSWVSLIQYPELNTTHSSPYFRWSIYLNRDDKEIHTRISGIGSSSPDNVFNLNTWFQSVISYESGTVRFYYNGQLVGTTTGQPSLSYPSNNNVYIGANASGSEVMEGPVSMLRVYNIRLSDTEIQQNYNAFKDRFGL